MNRYDIAKGKKSLMIPVERTATQGTLRKCEMWKNKEDGAVQGAVCYLKFLCKFEEKEKYLSSPYSIRITAQVPCDFHIPLKGQILMKLDGEEFRITILEIKQDYVNPKIDVEIYGMLSIIANALTPAERKELRSQNFERLSVASKYQSLQ
jgi:hypothetical protein